MNQNELDSYIPDLCLNFSKEHPFILGHIIKEEVMQGDIRLLKVIKFSNYKKQPLSDFLVSLVIPKGYGKIENFVSVKVYPEELTVIPKGQCEQFQNIYVIIPVGEERWNVEALKNTKLFSFLVNLKKQTQVQDEMNRKMMGLLERSSKMVLQIENNSQAKELAREIAQMLHTPQVQQNEVKKTTL